MCSRLGHSGDNSSAKRRQIGRHRERAVLRFVDHCREMRRGEARIERVADKARAHRRVIHFEMVLRVPRQRADAVAELEAERSQCAREPVAACAQRGIADAARRACPHRR